MYSQSYSGKSLKSETKSFLKPIPRRQTEPPLTCIERFFCPRATMADIYSKSRDGSLGYSDNVNTQGIDGMTALFAAAYLNETKAMERLIMVGADPDLPDDFLQTPLFVASFQGNTKAIEILLNAKSDPNLPQENGVTPLVIASGRGHIEAVKLLLDYGARVDYPVNELKWTALHVAASKGHIEIVELLMNSGAYFDLESKNNLNFLCFLSLHLSEPVSKKIEKLLIDEHPEVLLNFIQTMRHSQKLLQVQAFEDMVEFMKDDVIKEKLTPILTIPKPSTPEYYSPQTIPKNLRLTLPSFSSPRLISSHKSSPAKKFGNMVLESKLEEKSLNLSPRIA